MRRRAGRQLRELIKDWTMLAREESSARTQFPGLALCGTRRLRISVQTVLWWRATLSDFPSVPGSTATEPDYGALGWRFGALTVQRFGAMLGPLTFVLPSGRAVSPLFQAPWAAEVSDPAVLGVIAHLRGEWPCVPFGVQPEPREFTERWAAPLRGATDRTLLHGHGANVEWRFTRVSAATLELTCAYPADDDIHSLTRCIRAIPDEPAVELILTVRARRPTRVPIGLHFTFGSVASPVVIRPGRFEAGWTYPGPLGASQAFARDRPFADLARVPGCAAGSLDATRFPFEHPNEDLLQLTGVEGSCSLDYPEQAYRVTLAWNREHFPSLHLWLSNRAVKTAPLSGRTVALGVEPVCSAFGLGKGVSAGANPIAASGTKTAIDIDPGHPFETTYRISAADLAI